jgi:hypothetical protein
MIIKKYLTLLILIFLTKESFALDIFDKKKEKINKEKVTLDKIDPERFGEIAILQGLNKVTAKSSRLETKVEEEIVFGQLKIKVLKCIKSRPEERPENKILIKISELQTEEREEGKNIFFGWMFSSSPSLSSLEHPIYDITAIECKKADSSNR